METAPFFADIADGPDDGAAWWLTAEDGVRIRIGLWNRDAQNGTVLLFPGRTEYIEKYGRTAAGLAERGFATLAIDWRGQGIADRLIDDPVPGHVTRFLDYQKDVAAMVAAAREMSLPEPFHLLAHSMGGCIGLRALHEGLPVNSACFSGPMWGISLAPATRPAAWVLSWAAKLLGLGHHYAPGTGSESYVDAAPFEDNMLTTDPDMWRYMKDQVSAHPEFLLGGPSLRWLHEALSECRQLDSMPSPRTPALTFLGENERIVDPSRIHSRMSRWSNGQLEIIDPGEHEVLMDSPETQSALFDSATAFFAEYADRESVSKLAIG